MYGVTVNPSTIQHPSVGMGCFPTQNFRKRKPVKYDCGTILYTAMNDGPPESSYGEGTMAVSPQDFKSWAVHLHKITKFSDGHTDNFWLVPVKVNFLRYIDATEAVPGKLTSCPPLLSTSRTLNDLPSRNP